MPLVPLEPQSIAHATEDSLLKLSVLSEEAQSHAGGEELKEAATRRYSDEKERLEIWAYEHDVKSGNLDHKLRDASILRKRVLSLLAQLSGTTDTKSLSDGDEETFKDAGFETLTSPVHLLLSREDDDATSLSLDTDFTLPDSLSDSPLTHIHDVVNLLFGLGPTLLDPAPRDRFECSAHKDAAHYDIDHVQARFPNAHKSLLERLGRANWERRQYLIRLRSKLNEDNHDTPGLDAARPVKTHLEKLTTESDASESGIDSSDDDVSDVVEAPTASSQAYDLGLETDPSIRSPMITTDASTPSEFQFSVNDVESTALTEPSKGVAQAEPAGVRYAVPAPPHPNERLGGDEFLCPFCAHKASDMKSRAEWK